MLAILPVNNKQGTLADSNSGQWGTLGEKQCLQNWEKGDHPSHGVASTPLCPAGAATDQTPFQKRSLLRGTPSELR